MSRPPVKSRLMCSFNFKLPPMLKATSEKKRSGFTRHSCRNAPPYSSKGEPIIRWRLSDMRRALQTCTLYGRPLFACSPHLPLVGKIGTLCIGRSSWLQSRSRDDVRNYRFAPHCATCEHESPRLVGSFFSHCDVSSTAR